MLAVLAADPEAPYLVTTADHALLTPEMLHFVANASDASDADLLVAFVSRSVVRRDYPDSPRTFFRLRGEAWTGANLGLATWWLRESAEEPGALIAAVVAAGLAPAVFSWRAAYASVRKRTVARLRSWPRTA